MNKKLAGTIVILAGAFCLLVSPAPAVAQGNTWVGANLAQMVEAAGWRLGIMRINAAFTLANAGYDTDVYYGYTEESVPDWTFSAGLPVQILVPLGKKVVLDVSDTPQYLFYLDTERERAWNNTFRGLLHIALDRVYVQAGGRRADVHMRFSPELDINVHEKRDGLDGLFFWQASQSTSFAFLYNWARYDYGDAEYLGMTISEMLNRDEQHFDLVTYIQPSSRTRLSLDGQYGAFAFLTGEGARDAQSYAVFGGIEFLPRAGEVVAGIGLRGGLRLGYMYFDMEEPDLNDGSGFSGEADIILDLTARTSLHGTFSRGFQFSIYAGATYFVSTRYGGGFLHRLSPRAALSYDVSFVRTSYPEGGVIEGLQDQFTSHAVNLNLRLGRHLDMVFMGTFGRRTREGSDFLGNRSFFGLGLTYGHVPAGMSAPISGMSR